MNAVDILKDLMPIAGALLGGPAGAAGLSYIASKIGVKEATVESVTNALKGISPLELKQLEQDLLKWTIQEQNKAEETRLLDVQDARKRDSAYVEHGRRNYRADFMVLISWLLVGAIIWKVWSVPDLDDYAKATITLILGRLLGYIDQVFQFEFGSTRNNRDKDLTIQNLTKG
jgi:hypothetical protein